MGFKVQYVFGALTFPLLVANLISLHILRLAEPDAETKFYQYCSNHYNSTLVSCVSHTPNIYYVTIPNLCSRYCFRVSVILSFGFEWLSYR